MNQLCFFVREPLSFSIIEDSVGETIILDGTVYTQRSVHDDELVFYDWIIDQDDQVHALEIHLPADHSLLESRVALGDVALIDTDCFVRMWLNHQRSGEPQGMEAFGDICFFHTSEGDLAIMVALDNWLTPPQIESIMSRKPRVYRKEKGNAIKWH